MTALYSTCCYYTCFTFAESCCVSPEGLLTVSSQDKNEHPASLTLPHPNCFLTDENTGVSKKPTVIKYPYLIVPNAVLISILTHSPENHV